MKLILTGILMISFLMFAGTVAACGERDVLLVDSLEAEETLTAKSACVGTPVQLNRENEVVVERSELKITEHQAKHILEDYLKQEYGDKLKFSTATNTEIKGHEKHTHGHGRLQDSHGTISYSFLVEGEDFYKGKAYPMYVDAKTGEVYGVGCGFGAGPVVFTPDLSKYPDTDYSDTEYHSYKGGNSFANGIVLKQVEFDIFGSIAAFFRELFGL